MRIDAVHNRRVKAWAQLQTVKERRKTGRFLIEGFHLVEEVLRSGWEVEAVLVEIGKPVPPVPGRVEVIQVSPAVMRRLSETETPQGIVAVIKQKRWNWEAVLHRERLLLLVMDGVQDPGNLGTMIRIADAAGCDAVLLGEGTVDRFNGKTVRAAMGSLFHLPVADLELSVLWPQLRRAEVQLIGTSLNRASITYVNHHYPQKLAVVVGNEGKGLSEQVLKAMDTTVHIPIIGQAESLNVASAAGIILYEVARQWGRV